MRPSVRATIGAILLGVITMSPPFLTGALGLQMRTELDLGQADLGLTVSGFFLVTALCSPLLGGWADRLGAVRGLRISAALVAVTMVAVAVGARSGLVLAALLALAGIANGIGGPTASLLISRHVVGRQALAFGLKQAAVPATTLLAGLAVPVLALTVGWRWAFGAAAAVAALLAIGASGLSDDHPEVRGRGAGAPLHVGPLVLIALAFGCATAAATGLSSFLVDLGVDRGLGEGGAGLLLAGISVATIASRIAVGWHADRPHVDPSPRRWGWPLSGRSGTPCLPWEAASPRWPWGPCSRSRLAGGGLA